MFFMYISGIGGCWQHPKDCFTSYTLPASKKKLNDDRGNRWCPSCFGDIVLLNQKSGWMVEIDKGEWHL